MKKRLVISLAAAIVASVSGYGIYQSRQINVMSDVIMANVEALASFEGTNAERCYIEQSSPGSIGFKKFCDKQTSENLIYPCPERETYGFYSETAKD